MSSPKGADRFWHEAAYFAALVFYLCDHKSDKETDAEVVEILTAKPWMKDVLIDALFAYSKIT